jgi:hypothetical protein
MADANRNLIWPIVLIVIGVLFLAHNLGYLAFAQLRELIGTWWPLILIALGIGGLLNRKRL